MPHILQNTELLAHFPAGISHRAMNCRRASRIIRHLAPHTLRTFVTLTSEPTPSLREKVIAGAAWMVAIKWSYRLLGLVSTVILARILTPEDFGVVAVVTALVAITDAFFDFGFDLALIKKQDAAREDFDSIWTLRLLKTVIFGAVVAIASPFIADYSGSPEVMLVGLVVAASIALKGLENIGTVTYQKELEFNNVFKYKVYPRVLGVITTIGLAIALESYWAIAFGILANSVYTIAFSYTLNPFRPRFRLSGFEHLWNFSKWVIVTNMSRQTFNALDRFLLSGWVSKEQLGYFAVGGNLASILTVELLTPVGSALMPGFAKLQSEPERLRAAFIQAMSVFIGLVTPAGIGVYLAAPELVKIILGSQWLDAIAIVSLFALFYLFFSCSEILSDFMAMVGLIRQSAMVNVGRTAVFLATVYFAFTQGGIEGIIILKIGLAIAEVLALYLICARFLKLSPSSVVSMVWRPLLAVGCMVVTVNYVSGLAYSYTALELLAKVGVGALVYALVSLTLWMVAQKPKGMETMAIELLMNRLGPVILKLKLK